MDKKTTLLRLPSIAINYSYPYATPLWIIYIIPLWYYQVNFYVGFNKPACWLCVSILLILLVGVVLNLSYVLSLPRR